MTDKNKTECVNTMETITRVVINNKHQLEYRDAKWIVEMASNQLFPGECATFREVLVECSRATELSDTYTITFPDGTRILFTEDDIDTLASAIGETA